MNYAERRKNDESFLIQIDRLRSTNTNLLAQIKNMALQDSNRLDWLDKHCSFVADSEYNIGPYKIGQLRQMADDGILQDETYMGSTD